MVIPDRLGVGTRYRGEGKSERSGLYYTLLCRHAVCVCLCSIYMVGATCYLLCVFLHKTLKYSADKTLIGWSESHHGNYARELSMNAARRSSHTHTNAKWTCDRLRVSRPIRICPQKGAAEASVVSDSEAHQRRQRHNSASLTTSCVLNLHSQIFGDTLKCFKCSGTSLKTHLKVQISQNLMRFESFFNDHIIRCAKPWTYPRSQ